MAALLAWALRFRWPELKKEILFSLTIFSLAALYGASPVEISPLLLIGLASFTASQLAVRFPRFRAALLVALLALVIAAFTTFKYGAGTWAVAGLIGLSFISFRSLSAYLDIAFLRRPAPDFLVHFTYVFFFPCLVAGPLDRISHFENSLKEKEGDKFLALRAGTDRILIGLVKKILLSPLFQWGYSLGMESFLFPTQFLAHGCLYLAIYFDFSGYCDVAIGAGKWMGIRVPENFLEPFRAASLRDFWARWHITFMHGMRDYIYLPTLRALSDLGLRRPIPLLVIGNLLVFLLMGLWHGATLDFALYGIYHGLGVSIVATYSLLYRRPARSAWPGRIATQVYIVFGLFFYSGAWRLWWKT